MSDDFTPTELPENELLDSIFEDDLPEDHRSGVIAVVGRPNVGKSTLINRILDQKIAIVTNKPQTTRKQQLGIYTNDRGQILFVDTPGLHDPHHKLGEYMVNVAEQAIKDADLILWVMDASELPQRPDEFIAETLKRLKGDTPVILALNKADLLENPGTSPETHLGLIEYTLAETVSGAEGIRVKHLVKQLMELLPQGPRYYPADQVSEVNLRFIAAEMIREKVILHTEKEIPHSVAVEIEEYKDRTEQLTYISAIIYVERNSQKGIIIGKNGEMIKQLGMEARKEIARTLGHKVFLDLRVKVLKNWRSDDALMRRLGYFVPKDN